MMDRRLDIGLVVPQFEEFPDFYRMADQLGFHSLWATDTLFNYSWEGGGGRPNPVPVLESIAAATSHIRLGTVPMGELRDPLPFASETARIDQLSGGRLSVGLSQGRWPGESRPGGPLGSRHGGRLEESLTVLKRLWREDEVSFKGSHFRLSQAAIGHRPVQVGGIPVLVGGTGSASVRLAVTLADGWVHPSGGTPEEVRPYCLAIREYASKVGRDPDSLELGKFIYLSIDDNRERARARLRLLQQFYPPGYIGWARAPLTLLYQGTGPGYNLDRWCAFGPPARCAACIQGFRDIGINTVILCLPQPEVRQLARLHGEVLPLLQ